MSRHPARRPGRWRIRPGGAVALCALLLVVAERATAGPPFQTDDPEPVEFQHWEVYLASQSVRDASRWTATAPHLEVNYGVVPEVMLHLIAPCVLIAPDRGRSEFGYGDTELGMKLRLVREAAGRPQLGIFPLLLLPTGDARTGTGSGRAQLLVPLWLQKSHGAWTTYGGGGYGMSLGAADHHRWLLGWEVQRRITAFLTAGGELVHVTAADETSDAESTFDLGMILDLSDLQHVLLSAGRDLHGPNHFQGYAAYQLTFGPRGS